MKPTWLIERGVFREHAAAFSAEVERQGMACFEVDYRPGKTPPNDIPGAPPLADNACVVLWGTWPLMRQVQLHRRWVPGGWCHDENLAVSGWGPRLGSRVLNEPCEILTGVEAVANQDRLFRDFGVDDEIFVRPDCVHKLFTGRVVHKDEFCHAIAPSRYDPASRVVVSTPLSIGREWRCVVADDKVVASSQYRDHGDVCVARGCPEDVARFVAEALEETRWRPDGVFVVDVCEAEKGLKIVELNSFSCSGLYECDLSAVIDAASVVAAREWRAKIGVVQQGK